jgi:NAD(P)-dependent dehydrogenase (short-subunit alcohol dehydrogenase family)
MGRLDGRMIVVTGSTGIAAATAERARAEGATVFVISRTADHARALAERVGGAWTAADLADGQAVDDAIRLARERMGRIDGIVAVAGGSGRRFGDGPIHELTADGWDRTLDLNLRSQALTARAVTRVMLDQPRSGSSPGARGSIVLMSSVLATSPVPDLFATHAYAAAKGAIQSLGTTMAATYARDGIRVNVIAPALTATPMARRAADDPATVAFAREKQPLVDGFLAADDIAHGAIYLLGSESRAVTGQVLVIDGGWSVSPTAVRPGSDASPQAASAQDA